MICVVSVVDSISPTSMPINEFVIYRSTHKFQMRQAVIVCDDKAPNSVRIPSDVQVVLVGNNRKKLRNAVISLQEQCRKDNLDIVYHMHHQKSALLFLAATVGLGIRRHTLYTVHSTFGSRNLKYKISSCLCSLWAKQANCVSNAAFQEYAPWVRKIKKESFQAIPNGVDVDRIDEVLENTDIQHHRKTLVCVGRMIPLKNHVFLLDIMKELPNFKLLLIGAEDPAGQIRKRVEELEIADRVFFEGLIPRNDVFKKLCEASVYVSSSTVEGLPVSVLEAMRSGLVPIVSDIMPHCEIADCCEEMYVLPLEKEIWVNTIRNLSELSQNEFDEKSYAVRESVKKNFSLENMHKRYIEVYNDLV